MGNCRVSNCIYAIKIQREYRLVNVSRFVIACPRGVTTGGPEALHQLAKEITNLGFAPLLWDPDESRGALESASAYEGYGPTWTQVPPTLDDIVVLPEVFGDLIPRFYSSCQIIFWWLSVDNFFAADRISIDVLDVLFPNLIHCYQSEYACKFLQDLGINKALPLSDYLNEEFVKTATIDNHSSPKTSNSLIAVNPAKGFERTSHGLQGINENRKSG